MLVDFTPWRQEGKLANLYLVRHGQTDWNHRGRVMGRRPVPLNKTGSQQVQCLALSLKSWPIEKMVSSPLLRTVESAKVISGALGLPFEEDEGLSEISVGEWEGKYWNQMDSDPILKAFETTPSKTRPPGGETLTEVQTRAVKSISRLTQEGAISNLLLISHADTIRAILAHYIRIDLDSSRRLQIDNASLSIIKINPDKGRLILMNYLADPERLQEPRG